MVLACSTGSAMAPRESVIEQEHISSQKHIQMKKKVVVVGSINFDLTIQTRRLPQPGETIIGGRFTRGPGGKGANQAIAAARAGADVSFIARVGTDSYGQDSVKHLSAEHIGTRHVVHDEDLPTGVAFILVNDDGENSIVVASGANARLCPLDIEEVKDEIVSAAVLLVQLESPLEAIQHAIHIAGKSDTLVIVNPAPAQHLSSSWFQDVDIITPNKIEAEMLTGMNITDDASLVAIARQILDFGIPVVIITLGRQGVFLATKNCMRSIPAYGVKTIDSTGAGDVFSGSLAAFLAEGRSIEEAVMMAIASASISVTRMGAQMSAPFRCEIEDFINSAPLELKRTEDEFTTNPSL
jgi:ribokinase